MTQLKRSVVVVLLLLGSWLALSVGQWLIRFGLVPIRLGVIAVTIALAGVVVGRTTWSVGRSVIGPYFGALGASLLYVALVHGLALVLLQLPGRQPKMSAPAEAFVTFGCLPLVSGATLWLVYADGPRRSTVRLLLGVAGAIAAMAAFDFWVFYGQLQALGLVFVPPGTPYLSGHGASGIGPIQVAGAIGSCVGVIVPPKNPHSECGVPERQEHQRNERTREL